MIYGSRRITGVRKKFQKMLTQVRRGMDELNKSKEVNEKEINALVRDNGLIDTELSAALKLEEALRKFVPSESK